MLLEAFKMIEREDRVLVIAGSGPHINNVKKLAKALEIRNVIFTGFLKDISAAYAASDMFVSASDSETFGLTFIEAMHTGIPVIGVRRLGPKELIGEGKNGLLVNPGDISGLAAAMEELLDDPVLRKRIGKQAREHSKKYSLENSIRKTVGLYKKLTEVS